MCAWYPSTSLVQVAYAPPDPASRQPAYAISFSEQAAGAAQSVRLLCRAAPAAPAALEHLLTCAEQLQRSQQLMVVAVHASRSATALCRSRSLRACGKVWL